MKAPLTIAALAGTILLSGCVATEPLVPSALDGDRAGGTVVIGVAADSEHDVVDWSNAQPEAAVHCRAWGYRGAIAFGGVQSRCVATGTVTSRGYESTYCTQWDFNGRCIATATTGGTGYQSTYCERWDFRRVYQCLE